MFLARISRGRTIRQFVIGVILIPTTVEPAVVRHLRRCRHRPAARRHRHLRQRRARIERCSGCSAICRWQGLSSLLVMALVAIFFVSGADAASMVMGTLSQSGSVYPSRWAVAFWGLSTGAVAVLMLWAGGNDALNGLQTMTIIVAAPFVIVMIGMCVSLFLDVTRDPMIADLRKSAVAEDQVVEEPAPQ